MHKYHYARDYWTERGKYLMIIELLFHIHGIPMGPYLTVDFLNSKYWQSFEDLVCVSFRFTFKSLSIMKFLHEKDLKLNAFQC